MSFRFSRLAHSCHFTADAKKESILFSPHSYVRVLTVLLTHITTSPPKKHSKHSHKHFEKNMVCAMVCAQPEAFQNEYGMGWSRDALPDPSLGKQKKPGVRRKSSNGPTLVFLSTSRRGSDKTRNGKMPKTEEKLAKAETTKISENRWKMLPKPAASK